MENPAVDNAKPEGGRPPVDFQYHDPQPALPGEKGQPLAVENVVLEAGVETSLVGAGSDLFDLSADWRQVVHLSVPTPVDPRRKRRLEVPRFSADPGTMLRLHCLQQASGLGRQREFPVFCPSRFGDAQNAATHRPDTGEQRRAFGQGAEHNNVGAAVRQKLVDPGNYQIGFARPELADCSSVDEDERTATQEGHLQIAHPRLHCRMLDSSCENAAERAVLPEAQHARTDHFSAETTNKQKVVKITVWMALLFKPKRPEFFHFSR